jgi:hypothetical protein
MRAAVRLTSVHRVHRIQAALRESTDNQHHTDTASKPLLMPGGGGMPLPMGATKRNETQVKQYNKQCEAFNAYACQSQAARDDEMSD